jgi:hypothetical protein
MEFPDTSGQFKPVWAGSAPLGWRNDPNPEPKKIFESAECDLCHVLKHPRELKLSPMFRDRIPYHTFNRSCRMAVTLQARGSQGKSNFLRVEILWDGEWSDSATEMMSRLAVRATSRDPKWLHPRGRLDPG